MSVYQHLCFISTPILDVLIQFNQIFELLVYFYLKTLIYAFSFVRTVCLYVSFCLYVLYVECLIGGVPHIGTTSPVCAPSSWYIYPIKYLNHVN